MKIFTWEFLLLPFSAGVYFDQVESNSNLLLEFTTSSSTVPTTWSSNLSTNPSTNLSTNLPTNMPTTANDLDDDETKLSRSNIAIVSIFGVIHVLLVLAIIPLVIFFKYKHNAQPSDQLQGYDQVLYKLNGSTVGQTPIKQQGPEIIIQQHAENIYHVEGIKHPVCMTDSLKKIHDIKVSDDMGVVDNPSYGSGIRSNVNDSKVHGDGEKVTDDLDLAGKDKTVTDELHLAEGDENVTADPNLAKLTD